MTATHEDNIDLTVTIAPAPPDEVGFGVVGYMVDGAAPKSGGSTVPAKTFTPDSDLDAAVSAGELPQDAADALKTAFAQQPTPSPILVIAVDTASMEADIEDTYSAAFSDVVQKGYNFYGVVPDSRTDADISTLFDTVNADGDHIAAAQSSAADWLTNGEPADFSGNTSDLRSAVVYHPTDGEDSALAWLSSRLAFSPDNTSAPFTGQLRSIEPYPDGSAITAGERDQIESNGANSILPYGSADTYLDPGQSLAGNPLYEIVTLDWFSERLSTRFSQLKLSYDARGEKLGVDPDGQAAVVGEIESQISRAIELGHLADERDVGVNEVTAPTPIPDADIQAQKITAQASLKFKTSGRIFNVTLNFQRV